MIHIKTRILLTRIVTACILFFLLLRLLSHVTPSGLLQPPVSFSGYDIGLWIFRFTGIIDLIVEHKTAAICFDSILFLSGLGLFLFPLKRGWAVIFAICLYLLGVLYKMYSISNHLSLAGFMLVMLPFIIKNETRFTLAWEGVRYFFCLVYFISFCWKVFTGALFYFPNGEGSVRLSLAEYIYTYPQSTFSQFIQWLLDHGWILNTGSLFLFLLEGAMLIGIFTKKYDYILLWFPVIIHLATYIFIDISYLELLVLDISLIPVAWLRSRSLRLATD